MSSSDSNSNASAFGEVDSVRPGQLSEGHAQVSAPGLYLAVGERQQVRKGGRRSMGCDGSYAAGGQDGFAVCHGSLRHPGSFHKGGDGHRIHLCCFFPCKIAFYFPWVYFSLLIKSVAL